MTDVEIDQRRKTEANLAPRINLLFSVLRVYLKFEFTFIYKY
jgi:hypothetical protein